MTTLPDDDDDNKATRREPGASPPLRPAEALADAREHPLTARESLAGAFSEDSARHTLARHARHFGTLGEGVGTLGEDRPTTNGEHLATQFGALVATVAIGQRVLARELEPWAQGFAAAQQALEPLAVALSGFTATASAGYQQSIAEAHRNSQRIKDAIETQNAMRTLATLGGPRGLRELQDTRSALERAGLLRREASTGSALRALDAHSPTPVQTPPPRPAPTPAQEKAERRAAERAAEKARRKARGAEIRALAPDAMLRAINALQSTGRALAAVAGDLGMPARELRDLVREAERKVREAERGRRRRKARNNASVTGEARAADAGRTSASKTPAK